jgi:hypothetical protein
MFYNILLCYSLIEVVFHFIYVLYSIVLFASHFILNIIQNILPHKSLISSLLFLRSIFLVSMFSIGV